MSTRLFAAPFAIALVLVFAVAAQADDCFVVTSFSSLAESQTAEHVDGEPFKGWFDLTATNNSLENWGGMHFQIFSFSGANVSGVDFIAYTPFEPLCTQTPFTNVIDNAPVTGASMDLSFLTDPVRPGDTASFRVYTDNTTTRVNFGMIFYPTAVPEPATMSLLGLGLCGMLLRRRSK